VDLKSIKRYFLPTDTATYFKCGKCYNYLAKSWKNKVPRCGNCISINDKESDEYYLDTLAYARKGGIS